MAPSSLLPTILVLLLLVVQTASQGPAPAPAPVGTGVTVKYVFNATLVALSPDGFQRNIITVVSGQTAGQGPLIECNSGDTISLTVYNSLPYETSIHFHGIWQRGSNQYDGVPGVTQCPIPPGQNFTYTIPTVGQSGTYWYHSHSHAQYVDGMKGPIVIHATPEPQQSLYDAEYVVSISDWYHQESPTVVNHYLLGTSLGSEPVGSSVVFNGVGRYDCGIIGIIPGYTCNTPTNVPSFQFQTGKRYRLRIINMSALTAFTFAIANHNLTIIEADGEDIAPYTVDSLGINIAQRYSVIVTANQKFGNYSMFADYLCAHKYLLLKVKGTALVQYTNATLTPGTNAAGNPSLVLPMTSAPNSALPGTSDTTSNLTCDMLDTLPLQNLQPLSPPGNGWSSANNITSLVAQQSYLTSAPNVDSITFTMNFNMTSATAGRPNPLINGMNYQPQQTPVLTQVAKSGQALQTALTLPNTTNAYVIPSSVTSVTFILNNQDGGEHPFHLHGHVFFILGKGPGLFNATRDVPNLAFNGTALRRDTITVQPNAWVALRFAADNPGVWFVHCHIDFHLLAGLAFMFVEHPEQLSPYANALPPSLQGFCNYTPEVPSTTSFDARITTLLNGGSPVGGQSSGAVMIDNGQWPVVLGTLLVALLVSSL